MGMEKKTETTGIIVVVLGYILGIIWGLFMGMEKKMETTVMGLSRGYIVRLNGQDPCYGQLATL